MTPLFLSAFYFPSVTLLLVSSESSLIASDASYSSFLPAYHTLLLPLIYLLLIRRIEPFLSVNTVICLMIVFFIIYLFIGTQYPLFIGACSPLVLIPSFLVVLCFIFNFHDCNGSCCHACVRLLGGWLLVVFLLNVALFFMRSSKEVSVHHDGFVEGRPLFRMLPKKLSLSQ